jgi:hypothetical protein
MADKNITYILGAGASHQALPVVREMTAAIESQLQWLQNEIPVDLKEANPDKYSDVLREYCKKAKEYGTFDTYARSLYLLGENDELNSLKYHLSIFFAMEIYRKEKKYSGREGNYEKGREIDLRYYGWLATILKQENALPENVHILSWNYDLQVELAIARFRRMTNINGLIEDQMLSVKRRPEDDVPFLVHLNGVAGIQKNDTTTHLMFKNCLNEDKWTVDVQSMLKYYNTYFKDSDKDKCAGFVAEPFSFAWEENPMRSKIQAACDMILAETDILVVIGYSFPSFNRKWDLRLLHPFLRNQRDKRIVVQTRADLRRETVESYLLLAQYHDKPDVIIENDCEQFYVPPELFELVSVEQP